jgi:hypothetical protein
MQHAVEADAVRVFVRRTHLVVNHQKSRVRSTTGIEFLGYQFTGYSTKSAVR